ncbi:hypothetical protein ACFQ1M_08025 [Sungkyunkwania multivorans]|uniref:Uncharacterized protein n=1 Tax=Sungkyunkwania multivorans TaxID=1173618 RepID=A0ABW3CWL6_9FLAO
MKIFTKQTQSKSESTKISRSSNLLTGSLIAIILVITPYIFYSYEGLPHEAVWETPFFTYESKFQGDVNVSVWIYLGKFVPLLLLTIWFFTCRHWWYHAILVPLFMYAFQLFTAINDDIKKYDEVEFYWLIPIMMIIVPIVYWIRIRLFEKYVLGIDLEKIEKELEEKGEL